MKNLFRKSLLFMLVMAGVQVYSDDRIDDFRIGLGDVYGLYQPSGERDIVDSWGGYIHLLTRSSYGRAFIQSDFDIGIGGSKRKDDNGDYVEKPFIFGNYNIKLGANPFSQTNPLFVNVGYSYDIYHTDGIAKNFRTGLHMVGLDLQGFIKGAYKTDYEYNVGYYYVFHGYHYLDKIRSGINDYSYAVKGNIGFTYHFASKVAFFANLEARYYDIAASNFNTPTFNRPKTKRLVGMVKMGLHF